VLVSATIADGPPNRVIEEAIAGELELVLQELVLEELDRVLTDKLGFDRRRRLEAQHRARGAAIAIRPAPSTVAPVTGDAADDTILAVAVEAAAVALVTGDRRHLLPLEEHRGVRLLTPQALLSELRAPGRS